jgi:hypothetical protein
MRAFIDAVRKAEAAMNAEAEAALSAGAEKP